jgi:transposase InsO family protein
MVPIPKPKSPFQHIHTDICGPLPTTPGGFRYILASVDAFSKFLIATPLRDMTAPTVANALMADVVCRFGVPRTISSDQGRQFVGILFKELCILLGIDHTTSTPYHQQANGQVEKGNHLLADMLSQYVEPEGRNWDQWLQPITFAYNTSVHSTIRDTPFFLNYGRDARLPIDANLGTQPEMETLDLLSYKQQLRERLGRAWELAAVYTKKAQAIQKSSFDARHNAKEHEFEVGVLVLYDRPTAKSHKFEKKWKGPYRVVEVKRPNCTLVEMGGKEELLTVHMDKLKIFKEPYTLPLHRLQDPPKDIVTESPGDISSAVLENKRWERGATLRKRKPLLYG